MGRYQYYDGLKALARDVRIRYGLTSANVSLSEMRRLYRQEGIRIDYWPHRLRKVRGAYLLVEGDPHVLVNGAIKPKEPRIFTSAHELKHHYVDQQLAGEGILGCQDVSWSQGSAVEVGAEVFAAELIYPETEFLALVESMSFDQAGCTPEDVVRLKKICPAPVSHAFLVKRLEWFEVVERGAFTDVRFQKLEERMFGVPFYRRRPRSTRTEPA